MSGRVTIEQYNEEQAAAKCYISYVEMSAYAPSTFQFYGFPSEVAREGELARYVDWNNSPRNAEYFKLDHFVTGPSVYTAFSQREADIATWVCDRVATLTYRDYDREARPISSLLSQFGLFRAIMALQANLDRPIRVFEVGPGNGYLGAMLLQADCRYASFDNAQSFYLWQNRLLFECMGSELFEWVGEPDERLNSEARAQHLPWWRFLELRQNCPLRADVFVSNTNLGEMNRDALSYTTRIARQILEGSPISAFLFTNIGDPRQNSIGTVQAALANAGFNQACSKMLHAYIPSGTVPRRDLSALNSHIPIYNPDGATVRYNAHDFLALTPKNFPNDMDFLSFIGTFSLPRR